MKIADIIPRYSRLKLCGFFEKGRQEGYFLGFGNGQQSFRDELEARLSVSQLREVKDRLRDMF